MKHAEKINQYFYCTKKCTEVYMIHSVVKTMLFSATNDMMFLLHCFERLSLCQ